MLKPLIKSMRLRTLPLSLAGVVCGGALAMGRHGGSDWVWVLVMLTACLLQILSNLSNEMGDHLSGVDGEGREGPNYGMTDGGLTVKQMWRAINVMVVLCAVSGLAMLLLSFPLFSSYFLVLTFLGAAAIWAATHYTLGKKPYGYIGLGDLFVFIFFGLVSVLGSYFVIAHTIDFDVFLLCPAVGMGLLSVAVLNVNNIRDMESDRDIRKTVPLRIGARAAQWYQTALIVGGTILLCAPCFRWWLCFPVGGIAVHLWMVWTRKGKQLDPALPILVISTFLLSLLFSLTFVLSP
ncbi:MAG: 1,4-dihydroxy-2-naphthoate octaprenyltransferase [Bacteroidales bacterium]|nr:1,4-dihydroxy-2-naphthoate octaprenyltransferase [Bacteroidales bacterium]